MFAWLLYEGRLEVEDLMLVELVGTNTSGSAAKSPRHF